MWKSEDWTLFVGETAAFVERLVAGGVDVEFHLLPGLVHGFDCCGMLELGSEGDGAKVRALKSF